MQLLEPSALAEKIKGFLERIGCGDIAIQEPIELDRKIFKIIPSSSSQAAFIRDMMTYLAKDTGLNTEANIKCEIQKDGSVQLSLARGAMTSAFEKQIAIKGEYFSNSVIGGRLSGLCRLMKQFCLINANHIEAKVQFSDHGEGKADIVMRLTMPKAIAETISQETGLKAFLVPRSTGLWEVIVPIGDDDALIGRVSDAIEKIKRTLSAVSRDQVIGSVTLRI